jgi:DNA-binding transcriptional ArsR family regulator
MMENAGMPKRKTVGEAEQLAATPGGRASTSPAPDTERLISDVETLKALSDPLRLRILEMMVTRADVPWSVKELAARLDVPQTRLYHHVELLVERDLLRVAEQRVVSGIIETRYRVAALSFRLDRRLLAGDSGLQAAGLELLHTVFDGARDEIARALRAHIADEAAGGVEDPERPDRPIVSRSLAHLTPARAAEFRARLTALINEYDAGGGSAETEPWGLLVAYYRVPKAPEEASHG